MEKVVQCTNIEKKYFLFDKDYKIIPWLFTKKGCTEERIPLTDINLTINKGDVIGFIGKNGAGKSTLMKIIAGLTMHTSGELEVNGVVNSLINLGAGFNHKYTGRQNIYYKGLLMGMSKEEVDEIIEEIIDFCELGDYFDLPLYMYSSGMSARLGFALAILAEHDILIVDEVFAVGDKMFRAKSAKKMEELFRSGKSIIFASHSDEQIRQFCNRAIFIDESRIVVDGTVEEALEAYNKKYAPDKVKSNAESKTSPTDSNKQEININEDKSYAINRFIDFVESRKKLDKADMYREIAFAFEKSSEIELAYKTMATAKKLRQDGALINSKVSEYEGIINNSEVLDNINATLTDESINNIDRFMEYMNNNFNIQEADIYREIAVYCETIGDYHKAYKYMSIAKELRPNGPFIVKKVEEYAKILI